MEDRLLHEKIRRNFDKIHVAAFFYYSRMFGVCVKIRMIFMICIKTERTGASCIIQI